MKIIDLEQRTKAWHLYRKGKIGSSHSSTIMGVNPFETKLQLWQRMKGLLPEKEQTEAMKNGSDMESEALEWFESECLTRGTPESFKPCVCEDEELSFLIASLDGLNDKKTHIVEVKCSQWGYGELTKGKIPPSYNAQIKHQMMVTGLHKATLVCYNGLVGISADIKRDEDYISKLRALEIEFYESLKGDVPPEETPKRDFIDIEVDEQQLKIVDDWIIANHNQKAYEAREKEARAALIEMGDDGDFRLCKAGKPLIELVRCKRAGSIDHTRLYSDLGINQETIEKYRSKESIGYYKLTTIQGD